MKVLCFGSMNVDYVYRVDHVVRLGGNGKEHGSECRLWRKRA